MKIWVTQLTVPNFIDTDDYLWDCGVWIHQPSLARVTNSNYIRALSEWRADQMYGLPNQPKAVAVDSPKRKWEIAFDNGGYQTVEAHSFILSDSDIAFHVDGQLPAVFWAPTRNIYHVKEVS